MTYLQRLIVNTLTFISLSVIFPTMVHVRSIPAAIAAALVLSLLNMLVKPVLTLLSLPLTLLTFGLFSFVINAVILKLTSSFVGEMNFGFSSFGVAILMAVVMSLVNAIVSEHTMRNYDE